MNRVSIKPLVPLTLRQTENENSKNMTDKNQCEFLRIVSSS